MLHTRAVRFATFEVRRYSREVRAAAGGGSSGGGGGGGVGGAGVQGGQEDGAGTTTGGLPAAPTWEHLTLQPLTCCVSTHDTDTSSQMWLTVEWHAPPYTESTRVELERVELSAYAWSSRGGRSIVPQLNLKAVFSGSRVAFRVRMRDGPARFHRFQVQFASAADAAAFIDAIKVRAH